MPSARSVEQCSTSCSSPSLLHYEALALYHVRRLALTALAVWQRRPSSGSLHAPPQHLQIPLPRFLDSHGWLSLPWPVHRVRRLTVATTAWRGIRSVRRACAKRFPACSASSADKLCLTTGAAPSTADHGCDRSRPLWLRAGLPPAAATAASGAAECFARPASPPQRQPARPTSSAWCSCPTSPE
ncbi:hypothetical protein CUR178_02637 [Leishmania enriettii]|uniref:Uncharacterized protein n=1 Tax=Leishmania enriettii TaxID=5663 RepID=A0A836FZ39_LEIEN|nr:hypothetical protein CUR178_02637 [Leishmania enriettii]